MSEPLRVPIKPPTLTKVVCPFCERKIDCDLIFEHIYEWECIEYNKLARKRQRELV